jgi:hypothetical protein
LTTCPSCAASGVGRFGRRGGCRGGGGCGRWHRHDWRRAYAYHPAFDDLDLLFAFRYLELGDAGFLHQVDQLLQLAQVHSIP